MENMTAEDLHLLLEQTQLSEHATRLTGSRSTIGRPQVAQLLQQGLTRIGKWRGEDDARLLDKYVACELDAAHLESSLSERL
jgi:hypothetical protein